MAARAEHRSKTSPAVVMIGIVLALFLVWVGVAVVMTVRTSSNSAHERNACKTYQSARKEYGPFTRLYRGSGNGKDIKGAVGTLALGHSFGVDRYPPRVDAAVQTLLRGDGWDSDHPKARVAPEQMRRAAQTLDRWGKTCRS